jgi:hypothetical protein
MNVFKLSGMATSLILCVTTCIRDPTQFICVVNQMVS